MNYIRKHSGVHRLGEHRSNSVVHFTRASTGVRVPLGTRFGGGSSQWPLGTKFPSGEGEAAEGTTEKRSSRGNQAASISLGGLSFRPGFCG